MLYAYGFLWKHSQGSGNFLDILFFVNGGFMVPWWLYCKEVGAYEDIGTLKGVYGKLKVLEDW
jgi:hypothetical protein